MLKFIMYIRHEICTNWTLDYWVDRFKETQNNPVKQQIFTTYAAA